MFGDKSYKLHLQVRINSRVKSILIQIYQTYKNQFFIFRITFSSPKSESKHPLKHVKLDFMYLKSLLPLTKQIQTCMYSWLVN